MTDKDDEWTHTKAAKENFLSYILTWIVIMILVAGGLIFAGILLRGVVEVLRFVWS